MLRKSSIWRKRGLLRGLLSCLLVLKARDVERNGSVLARVVHRHAALWNKVEAGDNVAFFDTAGDRTPLPALPPAGRFRIVVQLLLALNEDLLSARSNCGTNLC